MDDIDRFGFKFACNSTCCTVRPTPPVLGPYGPPIVGPCGYGPALPVAAPCEAPIYIPPRDSAFCGVGGAGCLPSPYGAGWIEVGYVYSVRRRRHHGDSEREECAHDWTPLSNSARQTVPRFAFQSTPRARSSMPPTALLRGQNGRSLNGQKRKRSTQMRVTDEDRRLHGGGCGRRSSFSDCESESCWSDCDDDGRRGCGEYHVHHHHYGADRRGRDVDDCCYPRRYRLFARAPYPYSCRAYGNSNYYQYAVLDASNPGGVLIVLDSNPFFRGGRCDNGGGCNRRWQEVYTGDLVRIPGERGPFRVHLFADDYNPPPGPRYDGYADDGYEY